MLCSLYASHSRPPLRGPGWWLRNMRSALEMKSALWWNPSLTQHLSSLWNYLLLFFILPIPFLHARLELHLPCLGVPHLMGEAGIWSLTWRLCGCTGVAGQCPLHLSATLGVLSKEQSFSQRNSWPCRLQFSKVFLLNHLCLSELISHEYLLSGSCWPSDLTSQAWQGSWACSFVQVLSSAIQNRTFSL